MNRASRIVLVVGLAIPGGAGRLAAEPAPPERLAFLETSIEPTRAYVGQVVDVALALGVERAALENHLAARARRALDWPVELTAPWLDGAPGLRPIETDASGTDAPGATLAVNGDVGRAAPAADAVRDERAFRVLRFQRRFVAEREGEVAFEPATLRFTYADGFDEDLLGTRRPRAPREIRVEGSASTLVVAPLPNEGRPAGFAGAVGRYELRARVDGPAPTAGRSFRVLVEVSGEGDPDAFTPPSATSLPGFHLLGVRRLPGDPGGASLATYELDVVPGTPAPRAFPALSLPHFDPTPPGRYRVATSEPIPIRGSSPPSVPSPSLSADEPPVSNTGLPWLLPVLVGALALGAIVVFARRRPTARARTDGPSDVDAALTRLRAASAGGEDLVASFAALLGARLGAPPSAAIGPDLAQRLTAAGVPAPVAADAAGLLERLVAARYGGPPAHVSAERLLTVARELAN